MRSLSGTHLEVLTQEGTIVRMGAVFNDAFGTLHGVKSAEISNALIGHEDINGVFGMVLMGHHGDNVADTSTLSHRGAREDAQIGIAGKVTGAANAVHHLGTEDVSGVDGTENVGF